MTIEGALLSRLKSQVALVSNRVYAVQLPQNVTLPAVTFQRISAIREHAMGGDAEPTHARFQVSSWAKTYDEVRDVADQVKAGLDRFSGTLDTTVIQQIFRVTDQDLFEPDDLGVGVFHVPVDFMVHFEE